MDRSRLSDVGDPEAAAVARLKGANLRAGAELGARALCRREVVEVEGVLGAEVAADVAPSAQPAGVRGASWRLGSASSIRSPGTGGRPSLREASPPVGKLGPPPDRLAAAAKAWVFGVLS